MTPKNVHQISGRLPAPRTDAERQSNAVAASIRAALILEISVATGGTPHRLPSMTAKIAAREDLGFLLHTEGVTQQRFVHSLAWNESEPAESIYLLLTDIGDEADGERCTFAVRIDPMGNRHLMVDMAAAGGVVLILDSEFGRTRWELSFRTTTIMRALGDVLDARFEAVA